MVIFCKLEDNWTPLVLVVKDCPIYFISCRELLDRHKEYLEGLLPLVEELKLTKVSEKCVMNVLMCREECLKGYKSITMTS